MRRVVVKFGGTSIGDGELVRRAAESVAREYKKGTQIAVVVSAMGHTTDFLFEAAKSSTAGKITEAEMDDIIAMGERTSVRIFASALRSLGIKSEPIDVQSEEWPIITNSSFGRAEPDMDTTRRLIRKKILPLMDKGVVPVICGFVGKDANGNVTTLGRGGSDITAFLVGKCLGASEVIIVTDVEGVMSADPQKVSNPDLLEEITAEEMYDLARYGAQILHHRALEHKDPELDAKIIHFRHGNLNAKGTRIIGGGGRKVGATLHPKPLAMLTVVGEGMQVKPGILSEAVTPLSRAKINIFGVSIGPRSFSLYVAEDESQRALEVLHRVVKRNEVMKSVTSEGGIAMVVVESEKFIETPGVISKLSNVLAKENINIIEIYSSRASISFFVDWRDGKRAFKLLKEAMEEMGA